MYAAKTAEFEIGASEFAMSDRAAPLVSVVIPAYNAGGTLHRALKSIEVQDYRPVEVIVVDDGSADDIGPVVASFPSLRIRVERFKTQHGAAAARNHAIKLTTGEFIAFLDADDEWLPGKLRRQVEILQAQPNVAISCTDVLLVDLPQRGEDTRLNGGDAQGPEAWKALLKAGCIVTSSVMTRRELLDSVGNFDPRLIVAEDQDLWIRLSLNGDVHHEATLLTRKYYTDGSLTQIHRNLEATVTLPMVEGHVAKLMDRLSVSERREILSFRKLKAGRHAYESGATSRGLYLILRAMWRGNQPVLQNLWYLTTASPPARFIKRAIRGRN